jgi:hypothetical protein
MPRNLTRREWLTLSAAGVAAVSASGWLDTMAARAAGDPKRKRACILLWMNGGPSQMDTFDLKPGHKNGGPYQAIQTAAPGVSISEHLPKLAKHGDRLAILRSMATKEADHGRATYVMRTGHAPGGPIQYPFIGPLFGKELDQPGNELPACVSVGAQRFLSPGAFGPGFLGPQHAPLMVGENAGGFVVRGQNSDQALRVQDLDLPRDIGEYRARDRVRLLDELNEDFISGRPDQPAIGHRAAYQRAVKMMRSEAVKAFSLDEEPAGLRDSYGRNIFGQGCLLARRLIQRGVPFVEVSLGGWDTHQNNFDQIKQLSGVLDPAWATLMQDLKDRGMLDSTLIVWMGEFGRTPKINAGNGRDHWANSWSTVLAGGGIKGGQVVGKTSEDGTTVDERPVSVSDLLATVGLALGLDISKQNASNVGRPIRLVDAGAKPIKEVLQ